MALNPEEQKQLHDSELENLSEEEQKQREAKLRHLRQREKRGLRPERSK